MPDDDKPLYAKFRRQEPFGLFGEFLISRDLEKSRKWTGDEKTDEGSDTDSSQPKFENEATPDQSKSVEAGKGEEDSSEGDQKKKSGFTELNENFLVAINRYYQFIPRAMAIMPFIERIEIQKNIYEPLSEKGKLLENGEDWELYEINSNLAPYIDRTFGAIIAFRGGRRNLPSLLLMGLVSSYDAFLAQLLRVIFAAKPDMLSSSEKNISLKDLMELGTVEAAREQIVDKEIESVLRQSHHSQVEWLEKKLDLTLRKDLEIWPQFVELFERRNLFTHTGGIASQQYLTICEQHGFDVSKVSQGDRLDINTKYLRTVISTLSEFGLKLIQVAWRKLIPEEIDDAESTLGHVGYQLISERRYKLAVKMLDFGLNVMKKHRTEQTRRRMVVNYANAYKLMGNKDKSNEILNAEDWSASSDLYKLCVAAVRDDIEIVEKLMPNFSNSHEVSKDDFREWPVFWGLKENSKFTSAFEAIFKEPYFIDIETGKSGKQSAMEKEEKGNSKRQLNDFSRNNGPLMPN